jgi:hypothetical protein
MTTPGFDRPLYDDGQESSLPEGFTTSIVERAAVCGEWSEDIA